MQPVSCLKKMQGGEHQASFKFISGTLADCTIYLVPYATFKFYQKTNNRAELSLTVGQVKNAPTYFAMFSMTSGDCNKTTHCLRLSVFFSSSLTFQQLCPWQVATAQSNVSAKHVPHFIPLYSYLLVLTSSTTHELPLIKIFRNLLTLAYSYVTL